MENFRNVDWVELHQRVTFAAFRLFGAASFAKEEELLDSFGVGPEDLANQVLFALLDPTDPSVTWNTAARGAATTKGLAVYLVTVMRHDFLDKKRAKRRRGQQSLHPPSHGEEAQLPDDPPEPSPNIEERLIGRAAREPLRKRLDDDFAEHPDDELQLYLMLQCDSDSYMPYKPREAAEELGIPVERIYLLKQKLERRLHRLFRRELEAAPPEASGKPL